MKFGMAERSQVTATELVDPVAFGHFFDATLPRVFGYFIARVGGRVAVAEDLTQETYLAAVQALRRDAAVDNPVPWLLGIARHKLLDHYRAEGSRSGRQASWDDDLADEQAIDHFDLNAQHVRDRVIDALDRLPASQRTTMVLRYLDGLSVPKVAALTGKSIHAVESQLARGRTSFKRHYLETEHE